MTSNWMLKKGSSPEPARRCCGLNRTKPVAQLSPRTVAPASLKTEWEEQIQKFTDLSYQVVFGPRHGRLLAYVNAPFFTIVNYEQMVGDSMEVNARL